MPTIRELEEEYEERHQKSKMLYKEAQGSYPSGVSHDGRFASPFPIYATRGEGTRKWDVDGNEYVDYVMGHGSLLFGYGDERVREEYLSITEKAMHMGACTEIEIRWAKLIQSLVPSARKGLVRATSSGSEAVQMAIRLARIYTGREKMVINAGAYHGTQISTIYARSTPPIGIYNVRGIPEGVRRNVIILPLNDLQALEDVFKMGEVACFILQCNALYELDYLKGVRELTERYGVIFIMDEVVTGFRYSSGGAQQYYNVTPDLTALGKIIGGGAPVGAVCGREEIMELFSFKDPYWNRFIRISGGGTWNAQPSCIAGGIAMMEIIQEEKDEIYPKLYSIGRRLTRTFNEQAEDLKLAAYAQGYPIESPTTISMNLFKEEIPENEKYLWRTGPRSFEDYRVRSNHQAGQRANHATYLSMINDGIFSYSGRSGSLCTKYSEEDLNKTEMAYEKTLRTLKENDLIGEIN
jgi:glutamate-1-semialdehyde 2,1-aminomutase